MRRLAIGTCVSGLLLLTGGSVLPAAATPGDVSVLQGDHYGARIFPDDFFTVADATQLTGRRVNFRQGIDYPTVNGAVLSACDSTDVSICDAFAELNTLDGFDIQPRVVVPFTGAVDLHSVDDHDLFITDTAGKFVSGLRQLTFDPASNTLSGISDQQLLEDTQYLIDVAPGIRDASGHPVQACTGRCVVAFTTHSASATLVHIRQAMDLPLSDPANAYVQAGFPDASASTASRRLSFAANGVFLAASVAPSVADPLNGMVRNDQVKTDPHAPGAFSSSTVPILIPPGGAGYYAFGSFLSPRYQYASASAQQDNQYGTGDGHTDGEIPPVPSTQTPQPFGADRLGVIAVTPNPALFPPPWPVAIYGPGFTRSKYDIFVTADYNASLGILTLATDPAGHADGPQSTVTVTSNGTQTTLLTYGRGRDLDGDGVIGDGLNDGVGPTAHKQPDGSWLPSHKPLDGLRSGLEQTVVDNMALARAVKAGLDIPGIGSGVADTSKVMYYGLSFGGIYGTMLVGTDPVLHQGLLNVPGGPIVDIARLSSFRGDLATTLSHDKPDMRNGGPGLNGFTEDLPLRNDPPEVITHKGAEQLQELFGLTNWYDRSGSPETFAPRIRLRPDPAWASNPKNVVFQTAYADGTVPNPTAGNLYRAGQLFDRVVYYRNDKTPTYSSDPHGWLADPTLAGRTSGEQQLGAFLATGQLLPTNPLWLETTIVDPNNLACLHYADPQTGQAANRQPFPESGDCPPPPSHGTPGQGVPLASAQSGSNGGSGGGLAPAAAGGPQFLPNTSATAARAAMEGLGALMLAVAVVAMGRRRRRRTG